MPKVGAHVTSKDNNPRKKRAANDFTEANDSKKDIFPTEEHREIVRTLMEVQTSYIIETPKDIQVPDNIQNVENNEISINYVSIWKRWIWREIVVDNIFTYNIALNIMYENEDLEPGTVKEYGNDWPKWKEAMQAKLGSLAKCKVFDPIVWTPKGVKLVGYKCVFVRK